MYGKLIWTGAAAGLGPARGHRQCVGFRLCHQGKTARKALAPRSPATASRADDVSTVFNNPAGHDPAGRKPIRVRRRGAVPDGRFPRQRDQHRVRTGPGQIPAATAAAPVSFPAFYGVFDITDRLKGGIAVTVPFGNTIKYNSISSSL